MPASTASLKRFAAEIRAFLETYWADKGSQNTCIETSIFLVDLLKARFGGRWQVMQATYAWPGCRRREDHCFARDQISGLQVDLTGDQFGLPKVIVTRDDKSPYITNQPLPRTLWKVWRKKVAALERAYQAR